MRDFGEAENKADYKLLIELYEIRKLTWGPMQVIL